MEDVERYGGFFQKAKMLRDFKFSRA